MKRIVFLALALAMLCSDAVRGDIILLKQGRVVSGTILNRDEPRPSVVRIALEDGLELHVGAKDIAKIEPQSPTEKRYLEEGNRVEDSVESHEKVAAWLEKEGNIPLANAHRERLVELDPKDNKSWRKLRYIEVDGEWLSEAKFARRFGVVRDGTRWRLALDYEIEKSKEAQKQLEVKAGQRLEAAVRDIKDNNSRRFEQQMQYIHELNDPNALPKLRDIVLDLRSQPDSELRLMLMRAVCRMESTAAYQFLCDAAITDPDVRIRNLSIDRLRNAASDFAFQVLLSKLATNDLQIIGRVAEALDSLGDPRAVPYLIEVVVTKHRVQVGGNGQTTAGFTSDGGTNFSPGGSRPQFREVESNNLPVLQALQNLTRQDFQYDKASWLRWYAQTHAPFGQDLRRDR